MPDPVSSLNPSNAANACIDDDGDALTSTAVAAPPATGAPPAPQCLPESAACSGSPSAVPALVDKFTSTALPKSVTPATPPKAAPVKPVVITGPTTSSGAVPAGGSYKVDAELLKITAHAGPLSAVREGGIVSVQYGKDNDAQVTIGREKESLTLGGYRVSVTTEVGSLRGNLGENNDDGSLGGNIGAGAELVGGEATLDTPYGSLTYGQSISLSLGGSLGVRDADHDGKEEFCGKVSVPLFTAGACIERFW